MEVIEKIEIDATFNLKAFGFENLYWKELRKLSRSAIKKKQDLKRKAQPFHFFIEKFIDQDILDEYIENEKYYYDNDVISNLFAMAFEIFLQ